MDNGMWYALLLFCMLVDNSGKLLSVMTSEDFEIKYDEAIQQIEDTPADELKNRFIEFIRANKDKARELNDAYRTTYGGSHES